MASISKDPNGHRRILFVGADKRRRAIRLGKISQRKAERLKARIQDLVAASITNDAVDDETARWVADLKDDLADKLAKVGLIAPREQAALKQFLDRYIANRTDVKSGTTTVYGHTRRNLIDFFGAGKLLREITPGDADEWRLYLAEQGLAESTTRRRCGIAKQFFRTAERKRLIRSNPFSDLKSAGQANPAKFYFITREETQKVIHACPDAQWRLIFALSRYTGLRCPSEHLNLRWSDIDWQGSRMTVRSPKTEHHPGGESRVVPIFPELRPYLEAVFDEAEPGTDLVISRYEYRGRNTNLRTQLLKIIHRAGLEPWPKLFQNLRSTRETELSEKFPMHVVCKWIGNTQAVAAKHYLQVTDDHFKQAAEANEKSGAESGALAAQNRAQTVAHDAGQLQPEKLQPVDNAGLSMPLHATGCNCPSVQVGDTGFEPVTSTV